MRESRQEQLGIRIGAGDKGKDERVGVTSGWGAVVISGVWATSGAATGGGEDSPYKKASSSSSILIIVYSLNESRDGGYLQRLRVEPNLSGW
jgi:hypothetical protein